MLQYFDIYWQYLSVYFWFISGHNKRDDLLCMGYTWPQLRTELVQKATGSRQRAKKKTLSVAWEAVCQTGSWQSDGGEAPDHWDELLTATCSPLVPLSQCPAFLILFQQPPWAHKLVYLDLWTVFPLQGLRICVHFFLHVTLSLFF